MSPVIVGSNTFESSDPLLAIDRTNVIRIGTDERGELRISVEISAPPARSPLRIEANASRTPEATVNVSDDSVVVRFRNDRIMEVRRVNDVIYLSLDLRPLGISIHSDDRALYLGSSALSGNTILGSGVGIALSTDDREDSPAHI